MSCGRVVARSMMGDYRKNACAATDGYSTWKTAVRRGWDDGLGWAEA